MYVEWGVIVRTNFATTSFYIYSVHVCMGQRLVMSVHLLVQTMPDLKIHIKLPVRDSSNVKSPDELHDFPS